MRDRIRLGIYIGDNGARLYGNRAFFQHLSDDIRRIIDCPPNHHCEYQTVALQAKQKGYRGVPEMKAWRMDDNFNPVKELDIEQVDVILMIVDEEQLDEVLETTKE
jgi:hypothetical protein